MGWAFAGAVFFMGCAGERGDLARIQKSGTLVVLTRNAPTTYYEEKEGEYQGPEYDLVEAFAEDLGVRAEYLIAESVEELIERLEDGEADFAAAGMTRTLEREKQFLFGPVYQENTQQVICRKGTEASRLQDLNRLDLTVIANSSYEAHLKKMQEKDPLLVWKSTPSLSTEQLLHAVWKTEVECTIADSNIVSMHRRVMPELRVNFELEGTAETAWMAPKTGDGLVRRMHTWFEAYKKSGGLKAWEDKYYGHVYPFDYYDTKKFVERIRTRLPKYRRELELAASANGFSFEFLAAVAYQESHWDPKAQSPTGVRGFMMLTKRTAELLGVKNRVNAVESIRGGARYLRTLIRQVPAHIPEPDRTWMALASYNVGAMHLQDARKLAIEFNDNPNTWHAVKETLPLLSQKKYYRRLKHGYARGTEPVIYVNRIRNYSELLKQNTSK